MKTNTLYYPLLWLALISTATALAPIVRGQAPASESAAARSSDNKGVFSLEFEGGNARSLIDAMREHGVNVIASELADQIPVPPFQVSNVSGSELFTALNYLLDSQERSPRASFMARPVRSGSPGVWTLVEQSIASPRRNVDEKALEQRIEGVVNRVLEQKQFPVLAEVPKTRAEPVFIGDLLERLSVDDVTTAINQAVKIGVEVNGVDYEDQPILMSYHPETNLLVLAGRNASMDLAMKTLAELRNSAVKLEIYRRTLGRADEAGG